jgi:hypothetical protein
MQRAPKIPAITVAVLATLMLVALVTSGTRTADPGGTTMDEMMRHLASEAVDIADKTYGIKLDYSTESIQKVEVVLGKLHDEMLQRKSTEGVRGLAMAFGAYIGESIRKGVPEAKWERDHPVAGEKSYPLHWFGGDSFPIGWCLKRIMNGPEDNVWDKFTVASKDRAERKQTK